MSPPGPRFTPLQGQYLSFIATYERLHGRAPAEADLLRYFGVTPPSVHQMILTLERRRLITRTPGMARSIKLRVPAAEVPLLERRPWAPARVRVKSEQRARPLRKERRRPPSRAACPVEAGLVQKAIEIEKETPYNAPFEPGQDVRSLHAQPKTASFESAKEQAAGTRPPLGSGACRVSPLP